MILPAAILPALAIAVATGAIAAPDPSSLCRERSDAILAALTNHDYAAATSHFDARMRAALDAARLQQVWTQVLPAQAGAYRDHAATSVALQPTGALARTPMQFANAWLEMRVSCTADGNVDGLFFAPGAAPAAAPVASPPSARDMPLDVPSPLGALPGTLTLPDGNGPFPAVLLVAGSGPNDRDESIGPNKPFLDIARGLAQQGIATFRYDKRTHVYGAKLAGTPITIDDEVTDDAVAALKLLATQPGVDARRVFVLGHSLGAMLAPRIADRDAQVAGVILLAAPTRLDLDTILRQTRYLAGVQHATPRQVEDAVAPIIAARDAIARADPAHPPAGEFFHAPASYWLSLRDYHPVAVAKRLRQPMLILQGERDYQVTLDGEFSQWQAAFSHDHRVTLRAYPRLSHLFMPAGNRPSPADYTKPGHVDARVIADIAQWIKTHGHAN